MSNFRHSRNASARKAAYVPLARLKPSSCCPSCPRLSKEAVQAVERDNASGFGVRKLVSPSCMTCEAPFGAIKTMKLSREEYEDWRVYVERVGYDCEYGAVSRHAVRKSLSRVGFGEDSARLKDCERWLESKGYQLTALEYAAVLLKPNVTAALLRGRSCIEGVMTEEGWEWGLNVPRSYFTWVVWGVVGSFSNKTGGREDGEGGGFGFRCQDSCVTCFSSMWRHVVEEDGSALTCPACGGRSRDEVFCDQGPQVPRENRRETTQRFNLLPVTRNVKGKGRYRKKKMRVYRTRREGNALYNGEDKAKRSERMWEVIASKDLHRLEVLVDLGIDVGAVDDNGRTPLFMAVALGWVEGVKLLLEAGADCKLRDRCGAGARVANRAETGCPEIESILKEHGCDEQAGFETEVQDLVGCGRITAEAVSASGVLGSGARLFDTTSVIDGVLSDELIARIIRDCAKLPDAVQREKVIPTCSNRKYYYDYSGVLRTVLSKEINKVLCERMGLDETGYRTVVLPGLRFLDYHMVGSSLPAHVDLPKSHPYTSKNSTHTIIVYLSNFDEGGETAMLKTVQGGMDCEENEVYRVKNIRGRALVFYHNHPHCGRKVEGKGKMLLRGECYLEEIVEEIVKKT